MRAGWPAPPHHRCRKCPCIQLSDDDDEAFDGDDDSENDDEEET